MAQVKGAFTVRFMKIGDDVYITQEIYRIENGERKGAALFQAIDRTSGALSVDWTEEHQQPIVEFRANSSKGYPVSITQGAFSYDGLPVEFTGATVDGWTTSKNGLFQLKQSAGKLYLKIVQNIATQDDVGNKQIGYNLSYISNGMINSYAHHLDIIIQQGGSNSHFAVITTPRIVLDEANPSTTLTLLATYGAQNVKIGEGGYTVKWFKDNQLITGANSATLLVTRDDVFGAAMYAAHLELNGQLVAQDGQHILDVADEYQVGAKKYNDFVTEKTPGHFEFYLMKNYETLQTQDSDWEWEIYNALGVQTKTGAGKEVKIYAEDCKNENVETGVEYYSDANYIGAVRI